MPIDIARAYLQAVQARDFEGAYRYISSADRRIRGKEEYLRGQQSLNGFALELARWFSAEMKVWVVEERPGPSRARLEVGYRLPSGDEVSAQLLDWNADKLNALSAKEQHAIMATLEKIKTSGKVITVEGRETVDLLLENEGWKIFEDWRSRRRVRFRSSQPRTAALAVQFLRNDLLVRGEEPFQVDFRVANRTDREMWVKVKHSFAPREIEKQIDMIACGSLVPFRLDPGETREISSAYIVRRAFPARPQVSINYDFSPAFAAVARQSSVLSK